MREDIIMKTGKKCTSRLLGLLIFITTILSLTIVFSASASAADSAYYVAKTGSNAAGDGSSSKPWGTIQFGVGKLSAGKTLIIGEGVYNEKITIGVSGTASNYVTIKGAEGKRVILDGTGINSKNGAGNYMVYMSDRSYVRIENMEICNNYSPTTGWNINSGIHIDAYNGSVGVQIVNNKVYNIDGETFHYQAVSEGGPCAHGIAVYGYGGSESKAISNLLIEGNEVYNCKLGYAEAIAVTGNTKDWKVINNYVHDNNNIAITAIGGEGRSGSSALDRARNGLIVGNIVINNTCHGNLAFSNGGGADGIYVDGGKDIVIENNYVVASDYGIEIGTENGSSFRPSGIIVRNNVVAYNESGGILLGGQNGALDILVENNTVYQKAGCGIERNAGSGPYTVKNNIIMTTGNVPYVTGNGGTITYTNNAYYGGPSGRPSGDTSGQVLSALPVSSLTNGDFTPKENISGGARLTAATTPDLTKAKANYAARESALSAQVSVFNVVNNTANKGSSGKPLTLDVISSDIRRYFENLPGVAGTGTDVYMKFANTNTSTFVDNDNAGRYYGIVTVGQGADGKVNYNKITQVRAITNMRVYVSFPYVANGQPSWIERQVNNICVTFDPSVKPTGVDISLSESGTYAFPEANVGYGSQKALTATVSNIGTIETGRLTIALSGKNADAFTLSKTSISNIAIGGADTFTVAPKTGLAAGTHSATVTVSNTNVSKSFEVSFTVKSSAYAVTVSGSYATPTGAGSYSAGDRVSVSAGERTGYSFNGWTSTPVVAFANAEETRTTFTMPSSNVAVTANWGRYTLTYNVNSGSGTKPADQQGGTVTVSGQGNLTRSNYVFAGWNTNSSGSGTTYQAGDKITLKANMTLYAKWNRIYTLTYNANGGSGTKPADQTGGTVIISGQGNLVRSGYDFDGWNTQSNGNGTTYQPGASLTLSANISLYAKWKQVDSNTFTLTYNAGGGNGTKPADQKGGSVTLSGQYGMYRSGHIFTGWNTKSDGSGTPYAAGQTITLTGNMTLYAQWARIYTLTYNINGGSGTKPFDQSGSSVTLSGQHAMYRSGYYFTGWNTKPDGTGETYKAGGRAMTLSGNVTLYAQWEQIK